MNIHDIEIPQKDLEMLLDIMNEFDIWSIEKWEHDVPIDKKPTYWFVLRDTEGNATTLEV